MTELIIVGGMYAATLAFWAWREYQHDAERRELYSRLMARDLTEYAVTNGTRPPPRQRNFITASLRKQAERRQEKAGD